MFQKIDEGVYVISRKEALSRKYREAKIAESHFYRDIERIIDCPAFRALEDKTQVSRVEIDNCESALMPTLQRTRLTHTRSVELNSERLAGGLGLDIDLARAIANAHDLGHTPFGHVGEKEIDSIFKELALRGFNHNEQSLRVIEKLEQISPYFNGLNLARGIIDGVKVKCSNTGILILEGQIVDIADTISYLSDDIEDALYLGFLKPDDFSGSLLMQEVIKSVRKEIGSQVNMKLFSKYVKKFLKRRLRQSIYKKSKKIIDKYRSYLERGYFVYTEGRLVDFEIETGFELENLKLLLFDNYYHHEKILTLEGQHRKAIRRVFFYLKEDLSVIDKREFFLEMYKDKDPNILIKDYLALLTEKNFWRLHALIDNYSTAYR